MSWHVDDHEAGVLSQLDASEPDRWTARSYCRLLSTPAVRALIEPERGFALWSVAGDEGELLRIVVAPDSRRAGVGRALLTASRLRLLAEGVSHTFLEVRVDNAAARALYVSEGWIEVGRRPRYYHDGTDAIVMRWVLIDPRGS